MGSAAPKRRTPGGQPLYTDLAIELVLTLRLVFHFALRRAKAFARSVLKLLGLELRVPDHLKLSRRGRAFGGRQPWCRAVNGPAHLVLRQTVEVSMLRTAIALMQWSTTAFSGPDDWKGRQLLSQDWPVDHGFQCAGTRCLLDMRSHEDSWPGLLHDLGYTDLAQNPRFATRTAIDLRASLLPRLTAPRMMEWRFEDLQALVRDKHHGTIVPMLSLAEVLDHAQVRHMGLVAPVKPPRLSFPMMVAH